MSLLWAILLLLIGITALVKGADWLVEGAVALAERLGLTPLIIGLTIVAMGTSAPEVAASVAAAMHNSGDMAVGNVYGSNIANLALVLGLCAIIRPIAVRRTVLWRDIPLMLIATFLMWPVFNNNHLYRTEAGLLMTLFVGILAFLVHTERRIAAADPSVLTELQEKITKTLPHHSKSLWESLFWIMAGLVGLAIGARLTIFSAASLGRAVGVSEAVIGLTVVAVGTSLPELMTCLVATLKGHDDLSIGNLVGSNIFNALLVVGAAGLVRPFAVSSRFTEVDFGVMAIVSVVFALFAFFNRRITRPAGWILFIGYCVYIGWLFAINRS